MIGKNTLFVQNFVRIIISTIKYGIVERFIECQLKKKVNLSDFNLDLKVENYQNFTIEPLSVRMNHTPLAPFGLKSVHLFPNEPEKQSLSFIVVVWDLLSTDACVVDEISRNWMRLCKAIRYQYRYQLIYLFTSHPISWYSGYLPDMNVRKLIIFMWLRLSDDNWRYNQRHGSSFFLHNETNYLKNMKCDKINLAQNGQKWKNKK